MEKINTLKIRTPEGIVFSMLLAGPATRFLAWSVDLACIMILAHLSRIFFLVFGLISRDLGQAILIISYFLVSIGYGIGTEWYWQGQTVGKRLLRLRVMDSQGLRLAFSQVVIRNLLRFIDSLPLFYLVGGITSFVSFRAQRLGDIAANTIVISSPKISEPDMDQLLEGKYNSFRQHPRLTARLRQRVSPAEADIALQAIVRRNELNPKARVELFHEIADYLRKAATFPQEVTDGLSDEQYVRNAVDVLYRNAVEKK
jgi:uncharacterized RDD family membrane protein YckC